MKKSSKPITSPAPATPAPAPLPKLASKQATKTRVEPAPPSKAAAAPVSRIAPVLAAPRPAAASLTVIKAKVDVGFGNALYLRGEGPGLTWNQGLPMTNVGSEEWIISLPRSAGPVIFKFLLNDETWSSGEDYQADSGSERTFSPSF